MMGRVDNRQLGRSRSEVMSTASLKEGALLTVDVDTADENCKEDDSREATEDELDGEV
jgi:hypothetical protein